MARCSVITQVYLFPIILVGISGCATSSSSRDSFQTSPESEAQTQPTTSGTQNFEKFSSTLSAGVEKTADYHFSMAQAYLAQGQTDLGIEELKLTLVYDPTSALVHTRLAAEYVKKGMMTAAMESCKEALKHDPDYVDARLLLAGLYSTTQDSVAALNEYDRILKKSPDHEEATVFKAQVLVELGRTQNAVALLKGFLKRDVESVPGWYALARAEQQLNHFQESVKAFEKAIDLRPSFVQASLALGFLYEEKGQNDKAIQTYTQSFEQTQDLAVGNRLATLYLKSEKYNEAIPILEMIDRLDPEDMNSRVKLGLVYIEMRKLDDAVAIFKKIIEKNPDSDRVYFYLGSAYEELKQDNAAIESFQKVPVKSKLYGDSVLHAANLMKQDGRSKEAKDYVAKAIVDASRIVNLHLYLASLEEEDSRLDHAVQVLNGAVKLFPEDERVRYYLGSLYDRLGDSDRSVVQMEEILKINPDHVDALNYLGYTWAVRGVHLDDAEKYLKRAMKLKPDNGYITDSWGWYLFVRGRSKEAIRELEKAAKLKPNEPTILEHLADVYMNNNLREKALESYREAYQFAEDESARNKLRRKMDQLKTEIAGGGAEGTSSLGDRVPAGQ